MTTQTVPEPEEIPVAKLTRGTWIQAIDEDGCDHGEAEVLHVEAYQGSAVILYRTLGANGPRTSYFDNANDMVPVLSAERLAEAKAAAERDERIAVFGNIADGLADGMPAITEAEFHFATGADLRAWAARFDVDIPATTGQPYPNLGLTDPSQAREWLIVEREVWRGLEVTLHSREPITDEQRQHWIDSGQAASHAKYLAQRDALTYSREQDDPTPVSPARGGPVHTGGVVDGGELVDETPVHRDVYGDPIPACELCVASLHIPTPGEWCGVCGMEGMRYGEHIEVSGTASGKGDCSAECACGMTMPGFDSLREASAALAVHIADATAEAANETPACYMPNGFQAPEVIAEREADCAARHPGRVCTLPSGLTRAADESRGPLAGTTPVVVYFSFGYGQTDPDSGQKLIDHYVTVVAPTYEECREAMFASRYENRWSFDYLAGRSSTTEAVLGWTEHEVIIAPGTDLDAAEKALTAAADLLQIDGAR